MNKLEAFFWLGTSCILVIYIPLITIYGIVLFSLFHEFGHAFIASYYGAFKGFGVFGLNIGTRMEEGKIPDKSMKLVMGCGMFFNILTMSILMPMFTFNDAGVAGYLLLVFVMGLGDIYCIVRNKPFTIKEEKLK